MKRRVWLRLLAFASIALAAMIGRAAFADETATDDPWPGLVQDVFNGRPLADGNGLLAIDAPYRAEDAAIVPLAVRVTLPAGDTRGVKAITLVIDRNPAPVAATFTLGPRAGTTSISTRVRVDSYTNVHAVAELSDGKLYAVAAYVKASGGCSAPAIKNADEATAGLGQMKFRQFAGSPEAPASRLREAQIMLRHPNNSGLQMDQVTRLYVPAFFVRELRVWQGDDLVLFMDGGISISQDPNIRFNYLPNGARTFRAEAIDTENHKFSGEWPVEDQRSDVRGQRSDVR
jgi:sulfur-oxidizing protein SoxY